MLSGKPDPIEEQSHQKQGASQPSEKLPPQFSSKHPLGKFHSMGGQFRSPTDNMMSPATKKVEAKRSHLLNKIKPKSLADKLSEAASEQNKKA
ncbi:hypothetical protein HDU85_007728 [Gaertneriomyces sp. JEL0708]|nr:hypothetical protein HDU85_007728 [Gaertneriomyces sp. JEL0708]